ncbi:MAG: hypothetical protein NW220_16940 [Leptolyngbyaceae cyanobacterium bins.349]|nr:hypothetical protein [Leptolyngbyaceae cyanobacterium bins.349]
MKGNQVKIGNTYNTKVANQLVQVLILRRHRSGGWEAKNLSTNKIIHIKSAERLSQIEVVNELIQDLVEDIEIIPAVVEEVQGDETTTQPSTKRSKEIYIAPQPAIASYKPGDDIVKLAQLLSQGITKAEICQQFGWKSWNPHKSAVLKLGYGIRSDVDGKFWLIRSEATAA